MTSLASCTKLHQPYRQFSVSVCHWRKKPTPQRDMSKRNLQGEALEERLRRREADIKAQTPYKNALSDVMQRFKIEIEENERQRYDVQGELMKREVSEREQAAKNLTIIAKNNEDLRRQRELQKLIDEDDVKRKEEERVLNIKLQQEETRERNTQLVLKVIEESKDFVTPENVEHKITYALENETNFNYAITSKGEKFHSTEPPGNLMGWKGASPSAFILAGYKSGGSEWNFIFRDKQTGIDIQKPNRKE